MTSYCSLSDLKTYLNVTASTDDALLQVMLDAATNRIDSRCGRTFQAAADTTHYFDPSRDLLRGELWFDDDLSYLTSVINGDGEDVTADVYTNPRNFTPYYSLGFKSSVPNNWNYTTDIQNSISVTGRWAYMERRTVTDISRTSNTVTATCVSSIPVGTIVTVLGFSDSNWEGDFEVLTNTGTSITWHQTHANGSDGGGYLLYTPIDITTACRRLAAWMYRQKDTQQGDTDRPLLAGDGTVIMPTTLPQDVEKMLLPYTRFIR